MSLTQFQKNRQEFPIDELHKYAGNYIAWSPDGSRIVASSPDLEVLDQRVRAAGEDPQQCAIEGVPEFDALIGGSSLTQDGT